MRLGTSRCAMGMKRICGSVSFFSLHMAPPKESAWRPNNSSCRWTTKGIRIQKERQGCEGEEADAEPIRPMRRTPGALALFNVIDGLHRSLILEFLEFLRFNFFSVLSFLPIKVDPRILAAHSLSNSIRSFHTPYTSTGSVH